MSDTPLTPEQVRANVRKNLQDRENNKARKALEKDRKEHRYAVFQAFKQKPVKTNIGQTFGDLLDSIQVV